MSDNFTNNSIDPQEKQRKHLKVHPVIIQLVITVIIIMTVLIVKLIAPKAYDKIMELYEDNIDKSIMADEPKPEIIYESE